MTGTGSNEKTNTINRYFEVNNVSNGVVTPGVCLYLCREGSHEGRCEVPAMVMSSKLVGNRMARGKTVVKEGLMKKIEARRPF